MKKIAALAGLALLGACSSDTVSVPGIDAQTIMFNNFEGSGGWSNDPNRNNPGLVVKGKAHSGQYAIVVDGNHEFSLTYDMALGQVSSRKFKHLRLDAWAFLPSNKATATIGMQIMAPDGNTSVGGDDLKLIEVVKKFDQWVPVRKDFTLPDDIKAVQHLRLFMWRATSSEPVLLDDVKLSIID